MTLLRVVLTMIAAASTFGACDHSKAGVRDRGAVDVRDHVSAGVRDHGDRESATAAAIQSVLDGEPAAPGPVWADVKAFYTQRGEPRWVSARGVVKQSRTVFAVLASAQAHGLPATDADLDLILARMSALQDAQDNRQRPQLMAELDVAMTTALLRLGRDVAMGRTRPSDVDSRWTERRAEPAFALELASLKDRDLDSWLDRVRPQHPEYERLQQALGSLHGLLEKGGWQTVDAKSLAPGRADPAVVALRRRLAASGHLTGAAAASESPDYDDEVAAAVKAFQEHHTLKANGVADAATLAAMNVPLADRIQQVALNLERWRWMPDDFGARHLLVNIPSYVVVAREDGREVLEMRVVVGKPGNETPVFSGEMNTVVFSPYWNIPDSIVTGETAPALARDPKYLERNNIEIRQLTKSGTEEVNPLDVDWENPAQLRRLMFRQRPGPRNALGHVKFLFPNDYDVYLHDTPADALFARTGRAFSHGCVRLEAPDVMAQYVLRGDDRWSEPKILEAMNAGVEQAVRLPAPIPVHLVYFTATVDAQGGMHFLNDVYGLDAKQRGSRKNPRATETKSS